MKIKNAITPIFGALVLAFSVNANAAIVTFDTLVTGATSFGYDGDGDGINDVIFSTTDASGFNTVGPGTNMSYIGQPGLEGTTALSPDLRVDFGNGAGGTLGFGFATTSQMSVTFSVFNSSNAIIASGTFADAFTATASGQSSFPEALVSLNFAGIASYATFDFLSSGRYIIDNFSGNFGSTETIVAGNGGSSPVPAPASLALLGLGLVGVGFGRRKQQKAA